jgi:hypothetical protein
MIPFEIWDILLFLGTILIVVLLLFISPYVLPTFVFELLIKVTRKVPVIKWAVVLIDPLQKRYSSKLAEDVNIRSDARVSVSHNLHSNSPFIKTMSTLRVEFDIESRSPVEVVPDGAEIHVAFTSDDIPFKTVQWYPEISPQPPSGFEVERIPAKEDGRFVIEFTPPLFLYYTSLERERVGRTLYFKGWISLDTGFGNTSVPFTAKGSLSEKQVKHDLQRARDEFEQGFSLLDG